MTGHDEEGSTNRRISGQAAKSRNLRLCESIRTYVIPERLCCMGMTIKGCNSAGSLGNAAATEEGSLHASVGMGLASVGLTVIDFEKTVPFLYLFTRRVAHTDVSGRGFTQVGVPEQVP